MSPYILVHPAAKNKAVSNIATIWRVVSIADSLFNWQLRPDRYAYRTKYIYMVIEKKNNEENKMI